MSKLILGTASFGSNYGIKQDGQPSIQEIERIARVAWDGGIRIIHNSFQYGFDCADIFDDFEWMVKDRDDPRYLQWNDKKGVSIYRDTEINEIVKVDFLQLPINILDRRNLSLVKALRLLKTGYSIHARSVFLQGLLLMIPLPDWLLNHLDAYNTIVEFRHICNEEGLQPHEAALGWVLGLEEIDKVIVGVNSAKQLEQLLAVKPLKWRYDFSIDDEMVLDPRRWPE